MKKIVTIEFPVEEDEKFWKAYDMEIYQRFLKRFPNKEEAIDFMKDFTATKLADCIFKNEKPLMRSATAQLVDRVTKKVLKVGNYLPHDKNACIIGLDPVEDLVEFEYRDTGMTYECSADAVKADWKMP